MSVRRVVIHEWIAAIGGSEAVSIEILRTFPGSDFMALWVERGAKNRAPEARETPLRHLPARSRRVAALALTPFVWRGIRTPEYDTVITSSHALGHTARLRTSPDALYLSYVHSPARYIYSPELDPRGAHAWMEPAARTIAWLDKRMSAHVDAYACNSTEVQARIARYWDKPSVVIHPPVDVTFFADVPRAAAPDDVLLSVGRLISYKRHDFAIAVGEAAGCPVKIIGVGPLEPTLRERARTATVPVELVTTNASGTGRPSREEVREAMSRARALVFAAYEDFGIVPVEAAAVGLPVVGINQGGLRDSVVNGTTGILIDSEDPALLARELQRADSLDPANLRSHAQGFSVAKFHERFSAWVLENEARHRGDV